MLFYGPFANQTSSEKFPTAVSRVPCDTIGVCSEAGKIKGLSRALAGC